MKLSRGLVFNGERLEFDLEGGVMKMAKLRKVLTHRGKNESGQGALAMVLILLMLGAVILTPLLVFMSTGLKAGQVYESKMQEFYAADAGIEDGLWQIKNDKLSTLFASYPYDPYDYNTSYSYSLAPSTLDYEINNENVTVNITNVWIPDVDALDDPDDARDIIENGTLIVTGKVITLDGETGYQITISYYYQADDPDGTSLNVDEIGVWLGTGFHYVPVSDGGLGNLNVYDSSPDIVPHCGGEAIIWDVDSAFKLPGDTDYPLVRSFDFQFTGGQNPQALSWITTTGVVAVPLSWDADSKPYRIESTAGGTTAEAYVIKSELRKLGAAISGDYVATGNSLMMPDPNNNPYYPNQDWRSRLLEESSATIQNGDSSGAGYIPANAQVEGVYLYWSGFIDYHYLHKSGGGWGGGWSWVPNPSFETPCNPNEYRGVQELNYNNYSSNPSQLVENAKVNTVSFGGGVTQDITADLWEVAWKCNDAPACWYYACFKDVTNLELSDDVTVKQHIEDVIGTGGSGTYTFTLGHASHDQTVIDQLRPGYPGVPGDSDKVDYYSFTLYDSDGIPTPYYTGYPLGTPATKSPNEWDYGGRYHASYAGWSLIVIYSSPETKGHQLYLYDIANPGFMFVESFPGGAYGSNPDFDGDGSPGAKISGFLVPDPVGSEVNAAKITCFVGEGDDGKTGDSFKVTGPSGSWAYLPDGTGAALNDVWNSRSVGVTASGIDIDTFYVTWSSGILEAGDTWAQVDIPTDGDGFTLSYIILSFRSDITTGGTVSYLIRG